MTTLVCYLLINFLKTKIFEHSLISNKKNYNKKELQ